MELKLARTSYYLSAERGLELFVNGIVLRSIEVLGAGTAGWNSHYLNAERCPELWSEIFRYDQKQFQYLELAQIVGTSLLSRCRTVFKTAYLRPCSIRFSTGTAGRNPL